MLPTPDMFVQALLSLPLFSLVVAAIVSGVFVIRRRPLPSSPHRYRPELRAIGAAAIAVIVAFAAENIIRGYILPLVDVVDWWRYPTPIVTAAIGLASVAVLVAVRGSMASEIAISPTTHRSWTSFGPRAGTVGLAISIGVLIATSIAAGLASSADRDGRFIYLEIRAPNSSIEPLRPWFYGWSYGVPVVISLVLLAVIVGIALSRNAIRPYLRPDTVAAEEVARRFIARAIVRIALGATLLSLGGVLRFIARSGAISQVTTGDNETYELVWRYAALAVAAGWIAPVVEVVGFTLLLLAAIRTLRRPLPTPVESLGDKASR